MNIDASIIKQLLTEKAQALIEVLKKKVVRHGTLVRKNVSNRRGMKLVNGKFKREPAREARNRRIAAKKAWRKGKATRLRKSKRMKIKSLRKRNSIFH